MEIQTKQLCITIAYRCRKISCNNPALRGQDYCSKKCRDQILSCSREGIHIMDKIQSKQEYFILTKNGWTVVK